MPRNLNRNYTVTDDPQYNNLSLALTKGVEASQLVGDGLIARSKPSVLDKQLFIEHTPVQVSTSPFRLDAGTLNLTYNQSPAFEITWESSHLQDGTKVMTSGVILSTHEHELVQSVLNSFGTGNARLKNLVDALRPAGFLDAAPLPPRVQTHEDTYYVYYERRANLRLALNINGATILSFDPASPMQGGQTYSASTEPFGTYTVKEAVVSANGDITKGERELHYLDVPQAFSKVLNFSHGASVQLKLTGDQAWTATSLTLADLRGADLTSTKLTGVPEDDTLERVTVKFRPQALIGFPGTSYAASTHVVSLQLGQFVQRINTVTPQGAGLENTLYRVKGHSDWTRYDAGVTVPVRESGTEQLYNHTLEVKFTFDTPGQYLTGFTANITEEDRFTQYVPPAFDMSGLKPLNWKAESKRYRAITDSPVVPRHPDMPVGMGGLLAYDAATGAQSYPRRYGEYLLFDGTGPWVAYWNPQSDGPSLTQVSRATFSTYQAKLMRPGGWYAQESYRLSRNVVTPSYQVLLAGLDMSEHLVEFTPSTITLAGPANVFEALPHNVMVLQVRAGTTDVFTGRVVRVTTRPYANGRVMEFAVLSNTQFFDVDMSKVKLEDLPIPAFEDTFIQTILDHSGYQGYLRMAPGIRWRDVNFWSAAIPAGLGMVLDEIQGRYWNTQNGTTLATLQGVLQANMLDLYDLPNGDVLVDRIIPCPENDLKQVLNSEALVYCVSDGKYVNDPRLNVSGVTLGLDDGFAETEVEGFSNEINLGIGSRDARFVQNGIQNNFLDKSVGGYQSDSNAAGWSGEQPWPFESMQGGALLAEFSPKEWFEQAGVTASDAAVSVERIAQSWGFLGSGNKNVTWKRLDFMSGEGAAQKWPARRADIQKFVDTFMPALDTGSVKKYDTPAKRMANSQLAVGISAFASGDYVSKATFRFRVKFAAPDESRLKVEPLVGKFEARWAPNWFPPEYVSFQTETLKSLKPRTARRIGNQFIARIGSAYAVQMPQYGDGRVRPSHYDTDWQTSAHQLASFITIRDLLKTRQVEVSFAGAQGFSPNQFIAIARRPTNGPGNAVEQYDILMTLEPGRPDARVGSEAWVRVKCAYVGNVNVVTQECHYDMPLGWGVSWEV